MEQASLSLSITFKVLSARIGILFQHCNSLQWCRHVTISEGCCFRSRIKFMFRLSFSLIGQCYPCVYSWLAFRKLSESQVGFRNNFWNQAATTEGRNKLPEEGYWKDFKLVRTFIKANRNSFWMFFTKRQPNVVKTIGTVWIFWTLKKYSSYDTIPST